MGIKKDFWLYVVKGDGCWNWIGTKLPAGYGTLGRRYAHRISWEIFNGSIPQGKLICHHCDNPSCVRPDHLFCGTQKENLADCKAKGRSPKPESTRHIGEENGNSKLTDNQVEQIRFIYNQTPRKTRIRRGMLTSIARKFKVSPTMILLIVKMKNWKHIKEV